MMPALQNIHVDGLDDVTEEEFSMLNVSQVLTASDSVIREIHKELNLDNVDHIRQCNLNKRSVTKEKLAEWLETVCYILDSYSVPLLKKAVSAIDRCAKRIDELQKEKIDDQKGIIQLKDNNTNNNRFFFFSVHTCFPPAQVLKLSDRDWMHKIWLMFFVR
jgi:hypothetical protein